VIGLALGWTYFVKPTIDRWREANDHTASLEDQLEKAESLVNRRTSIEAERAAIERRLEPDDPTGAGSAIPAFLEHVQSLSEAAGFHPATLRYVRSDKYDAYAELRFELKARAPLKQLQDFLVRMAASTWYLRVQALSLNPREDGTIEAEFSLVGLVTKGGS